MLLTDPRARPVIAHRGASHDAPENTLAAFALALEQGAEAFELDVRLTSDGEVIVAHDATLARTAGVDSAVGALSYHDLARVDAGALHTRDGGRTFPWRGKGVRVPRLVDVLALWPAVPLLIEIKEARAAGPTARLLERSGAVERCVLASFDDAALAPFREAPWLCGNATRDTARLWLPTTLFLPAPRPTIRAYSVPPRWKGLPVPTRRFIRAAHAAGAAVHVWTVDAPDEAWRLWARGANGMVTNRPGVIRAARDDARGSRGERGSRPG